jgi:hypothetical protein
MGFQQRKDLPTDGLKRRVAGVTQFWIASSPLKHSVFQTQNVFGFFSKLTPTLANYAFSRRILAAIVWLQSKCVLQVLGDKKLADAAHCAFRDQPYRCHRQRKRAPCFAALVRRAASYPSCASSSLELIAS